MEVKNRRSLDKVRLLLIDSQIEEAANSLLPNVRQTSIRTLIYLLLSDWTDTKKRYNQGLLNYQEYKSNANRVVLGFLENILPDLESKENNVTQKAEQKMGEGFDKLNRGEFEAALLEFESVLHLFPRDVEALLHRGIVRNRLDRYKEAMSDFNQAIEIEPNNAHALICRGSLFMILGEIEKACSDWIQAKEYAYEDNLQNTVHELIQTHCSHKN